MIGLYFTIVFLIGVWISRSLEDSDDLFLAGRSLGWGAIGFSLFASNISSTTMIGLAGAAYSTGIAVANFEWMAAVVLLFMCFFCLPVFLKSKITTLPELLERRFDRNARLYYSGITIFLSIVIDTAGGLYAGSLALKTFFPQVTIWQTCIGLSLFAGLYTAFGGLKAVVYTDFIQAVVLLVGSAILTYIVFDRLGMSWSDFKAQLPEGHLSLIKPINDPDMPWLGTLTGVPILGFWYWGTNQYITQRLLGAKDLKNARLGAVLGAGLKLIPLFTMVLPGAMAIFLFPDLANPDMVYPTLIKKLLPAGVTGIIVAGLIAAIMSSVDSTLNSASTLVLHDFVIPNNKDMDSKKIMWWGRFSTFTFMTIAALWAPLIANLGGLYAYLQQSFAILVPPVVVIYAMGIFTNRGHGNIAFKTLLFGHVVGLVFFVLTQTGHITLHFTINAGITTFLCFVLYNLLVKGNPEKAGEDSVQFTKADWQPKDADAKWYEDYRTYAFMVLGAIGIMVIYFW
jgi:SSS family solute:Na+ symporter